MNTQTLEQPVAGSALLTIDDVKAFRKQLRAGEVTADQLKETYARYLFSRASIEETFSKKKLKELAPKGHGSATKKEVVSHIMHRVDDFFLIDNFTWHIGQETSEEARTRQVLATTDESIAKWIADGKAATEKLKKSIENPETLEEFRTFISYKGEQALTAEQKVRHDSLQAGVTKCHNDHVDERKAIVTQVEIGSTDFSLTKGFHTKHQKDIWIVGMSARVESGTFQELCGKARALGGNYSRPYAGNPAGFQFFEEEKAKQFIALKDGNVDRTEDVLARREESQQAAADRLAIKAERMTEKAEESLSRERQTNTHRRAAQAGYAEAEARRQIAFAETIDRIAGAIKSGEAQYLTKITAVTHVETLENLLSRAKWARARQLNTSYQESKDTPICFEDVEAVEFPHPVVFAGDLSRLVQMLAGRKGGTLISRRLSKIGRSLLSYHKPGEPDYERLVFNQSGIISILQDAMSRLTAKEKPDNIARQLLTYSRVMGMGLTDLPTLRTALREYLGLRGVVAKPDPVKEMERALVGCKIPGFFPTPRALIDEMLLEAEIQDEHEVLEPSAGKGDICDAIAEQHPEAQLDCMELHSSLRAILAAKGHNVVAQDFTCNDQAKMYDRILANPPFENGQDIDHVQTMYLMLKPGGRLVAIMGAGAFTCSTKHCSEFQQWFEQVNGTSRENPEGSFTTNETFRHTGVNTRLVVINKPR